ncbi:MAG: tripartite tricarboxylate transporter substrate binding protein [Burkholderiaceae bacterium]|nr:tripartite tricarboxylate transporter substrate binding protein [Burkholderiaceae bacterium]MDO9090107.1 tripartite tricarboxylate transporter substrate binding protein [Burkholderiaceae bacterium]MDP1969039.1 tripartite tricarboxylate transporter substrate binding protein [Burkholderiaceae bacterium]
MSDTISRRSAVAGLSAMALGGIVGPAQAQNFPNKTIRMVMPWPAGGSGDTQTRMVMQRLAEVIGQPVIVDNRAGANGLLGTKLAMQAPADGHTIVFGVTGQISLGPLLNKDPGFDPLTDLVPVSGMSTHKMFLAVPTASPYRSMQQLVAAAKADPGKILYGSSGVGAMSHIAGVQLAQGSGTQMTHVPYQSASHVTRAMIAGDLAFTFVVGGDLSAQMKAGTMRPLGVSGDTRSTILPEVPTLKEQGLTAWMPGSVWFGFFAPAKTPQAALTVLHANIAKVLAEPDIVQRLNRNYFAEPWPVNSREFTEVVRSEIVNFKAALKAANIAAT